MRELPTALLQHTTPVGTHYDWLLTPPAQAVHENAALADRLWTVRVAQPSVRWPVMRGWDLVPIAPHRRAYLTYQGPISDGRGEVTRVDEGVFTAPLWTTDRIVLDLAMSGAAGGLMLSRVSTVMWRATWR